MVRAAPPVWLPLPSTVLPAVRLSQNNGCSQPIRAGADDVCLTVHLRITWEHPAGSGKNYCAPAPPATRVTTNGPSGSRSSLGAYRPTIAGANHVPVARFSAMLVTSIARAPHGSVAAGSCGKGLLAKRPQHILLLESSRTFRVWHDRIVTPGTQGCEPQVPIEARLIGA